MKARKENGIKGFANFDLKEIKLNDEQERKLRDVPVTIDGHKAAMEVAQVYHFGEPADSIRVHWHYPHQPSSGVSIWFTTEDFFKTIN
jgi:hypothetical protein